MSTPMVDEEADNQPHPDDYEPSTDERDAVSRAKDFILWMRKHGVSCKDLQIGDVILTDVSDHFPRKPKEGAPAADHDPGIAPWYEGVIDPEQLEALRQERRKG